jgi:cell division transport system permease protein
MAVRIEYAVQESLTNIRRNFFMTFAAVMVVAVSLFLFGGVFLVRNAIAQTADLLTGQVRVTVFLNDSISPDERDALQQDLLQMPEVARVSLETKAQAYANFRKLFANQPEIVANTTADALPESFRIQLKDPSKFTVIRDRLQGKPGIRTIRDERELVRKLFSFTNTLRLAALVMALVVGLAATLLIATTIRMAIYARRKEIGIMKLVGATNWFIRIPFMMEGIVQGAIGALLAIALLLLAKPVLSSFGPPGGGGEGLFNLKFVVSYASIAVQGMYLLLAGIVVGAVGSMFGLRKFLDV